MKRWISGLLAAATALAMAPAALAEEVGGTDIEYNPGSAGEDRVCKGIGAGAPEL